ncbi:hypothetical protein [Moorena sp. SIO3A5]|nr:hypothetical protein [Moorena sp. SIO3A5]NEP64466.1 hypothetical protein [Moorena sp. SIO3A5]
MYSQVHLNFIPDSLLPTPYSLILLWCVTGWAISTRRSVLENPSGLAHP